MRQFKTCASLHASTRFIHILKCSSFVYRTRHDVRLLGSSPTGVRAAPLYPVASPLSLGLQILILISLHGSSSHPCGPSTSALTARNDESGTHAEAALSGVVVDKKAASGNGCLCIHRVAVNTQQRCCKLWVKVLHFTSASFTGKGRVVSRLQQATLRLSDTSS